MTHAIRTTTALCALLGALGLAQAQGGPGDSGASATDGSASSAAAVGNAQASSKKSVHKAKASTKARRAQGASAAASGTKAD